MSEQQRKAHIKGLLEEKRAYEMKAAGAENDEDKAKWADRVEQVEAQLRAYGHAAKAPAKRAETRPAPKAESR